MQENLIKDYNQMKRNFAQNYKTKFLPIAKKYEKTRKNMAIVATLVDIICMVGFIWLTFFSGNGVIKIDSDYFVLFVIPAIVHGVITANINLKIKGQEHITIIGPNGIGKTTFLKQILKILENTPNIHIGYMPQNYDDMLNDNHTPVEYLQQYLGYDKQMQSLLHSRRTRW